MDWKRIVGCLSVLFSLIFISSCNPVNIPSANITNSTPPTSITPPEPTKGPYYFQLKLSPVPDLVHPGELTVTLNVHQMGQWEGLKHSRIYLEFYWTNIHGSYREAGRAELVPVEEVLVSGKSTWEGDAFNIPSITTRSQIVLPREGVWKIRAILKGEGVGTSRDIKVAVADGTSAIMRTKEFESGPLAYLGYFSYGAMGEPVLDELQTFIIGLDISKAPNVGEEVTITYYIESSIEIADFFTEYQIYKRTGGLVPVPIETIYSGGELTWNGTLKPGERVTVKTIIKLPETGEWLISTYGNSQVNEKAHKYGYSSYVNVSITDTMNFFGWKPEPKPTSHQNFPTPTFTPNI